MSGYPIETVSRPYGYKKTKKQTKTVEADENQKEKKDLRLQNAISVDHVTAGDAETLQGLGMKASRLLTRQRAWQIKHPERRAAHEAVRRAILRGDLVRQPCEVCGTNEHLDAHHEDYAKPLDVTWLCRRHHTARHRRTIFKGPNPK